MFTWSALISWTNHAWTSRFLFFLSSLFCALPLCQHFYPIMSWKAKKTQSQHPFSWLYPTRRDFMFAGTKNKMNWPPSEIHLEKKNRCRMYVSVNEMPPQSIKLTHLASTHKPNPWLCWWKRKWMFSFLNCANLKSKNN